MSSAPTSSTGSGAGSDSNLRRRTRAAIIDAATSVLVEHPGASMAEIAVAAGVGRSTLHRHFADRGQLINALAEQVIEEVRQAVADAGLDTNTPREGLRRIVASYFELGPRLVIMLSEQSAAQVREEYWTQFEAADEPIVRLLEDGQRTGLFNAKVSAAWLHRTLNWLVYAGIEAIRLGELNRYDALTAVLETLEHGIMAAGPAD
ncbi:TetR/AcrR family transcriptional regulator [Amycolatopsis sp. CA-230715]|uniref:TetR/AcrR family transcriptional regulator n=1 Tax=Amycolatopsis sp. CA-230715 TaxID=2745196 RepID=UPI001C018F52|nr:TetR/AcrR family transcriptional regulator [Amycolatopsis sp. CA-230715]